MNRELERRHHRWPDRQEECLNVIGFDGAIGTESLFIGSIPLLMAEGDDCYRDLMEDKVVTVEPLPGRAA